LWNSLPDHFRTEIASLNSRVFCSTGMGPNVAVLHVDDSNFASGLLNFNFGLCIDLNKNPRGKCLFGLLFKIHTQTLQHKAAFRKKQQVKKIMKSSLELMLYCFIMCRIKIKFSYSYYSYLRQTCVGSSLAS
jgi:hypothetical protein